MIEMSWTTERLLLYIDLTQQKRGSSKVCHCYAPCMVTRSIKIMDDFDDRLTSDGDDGNENDGNSASSSEEVGQLEQV